MHNTFEIYTKDDCIFCDAAKELLSRKGVVYDEYKLGVDFTKVEIAHRLGVDVNSRITMPQVFVNYDKPIGGYENLIEYYSNEDQNAA